jgi:hypothetical protein
MALDARGLLAIATIAPSADAWEQSTRCGSWLHLIDAGRLLQDIHHALNIPSKRRWDIADIFKR